MPSIEYSVHLNACIFNHLFEISIYNLRLTMSDPLLGDYIDRMNAFLRDENHGEHSLRVWHAHDFTPFEFELSHHTLIGFDDLALALQFKLLFPEAIHRYVDYKQMDPNERNYKGT